MTLETLTEPALQAEAQHVPPPMALMQMLALIIIGAAFVDRRSLPRVFGAIALAIAISAVVIVPAIDHARDSIRSRGFTHDVAVDFRMPAARHLPQVIGDG